MRPPSSTAPPGRRPPAAAVPAPGFAALCSGAIVVGAIYFGRDLFVPLVLAVLLAFVLAPAVRLLRRARLGRAPSVLIVVVLAFALLFGIGLAVSRQASDVVGELPRYQEAVRNKLRALRLDRTLEGVEAMLRDLGALGARRPAVPAGAAAPAGPAQPDATAFEIARSVAEPLLRPLATTGVVVVFTIFVLLYREDLRDRLIRLAGARDLHRTMAAMNDAAHRLSRLFLTQVALNAGYGLLAGLGLWLVGLPNPVLWGIVAGVMRFVPFLGTPVAVLPPMLLAMAVDPGWSLVLSVALLFLVLNPVMAQVLEPLLYGHSTGLSPVSVILSAIFWAWMWGPVGLLLATPLTVCLVVLGRHVERLEFLEIMLGDRPPLAPEESFYQRALGGDTDGLVAQARGLRRGASLSAYYDEVALRGLALAQGDWSREVLEPERLDGVRAQVTTLLEDLRDDDAAAREAAGKEAAAPRVAVRDAVPRAAASGEAASGEAGGPGAAIAPAWQLEGAVTLIAGRGQLDDLAAEMAAHVLREHGFAAATEANAVLDTANLGRLDPARVRLCLLSVLEEGNSAAGVRHFMRRLRRQLPEARIVIALWHAPAGSPMLGALRAEGLGEAITTSLREAVALCQALAAQAEREDRAERADAPAPGIAAA